MACRQGSKGGVKMRTLFTRKEAAARLDISLVTLDEERQGGYLAYIQRKPGGRVWIAEAAIEEYLKRATHPVKSERQLSGYTHRKLRV